MGNRSKPLAIERGSPTDRSRLEAAAEGQVTVDDETRQILRRLEKKIDVIAFTVAGWPARSSGTWPI